MEHHNAWVGGYNGATVAACVQGVFCTALSWLLIVCRVAERPKRATYAYLLLLLIICTVAAPAFQQCYDQDVDNDQDADILGHLEGLASCRAALDVLGPVALLLIGLHLGTERWSRPVMYSLLIISAGRMLFLLTGAPHVMHMQSVGCLTDRIIVIMIRRVCGACAHSLLGWLFRRHACVGHRLFLVMSTSALHLWQPAFSLDGQP